MNLSAAPIIHARTSEVDFRSDLLVIPANFQPQDVQWARKYILGSTRYFELAGKTGRNVIFSRKDVIVSGLSIRIRDLYQLCGKEPKYHLVDRNRTNYAFIGFVIPTECVTESFDVPYSLYLDVFETYMDLRWNDSVNHPDSFVSTKAPYAPIDFPKAACVSAAIGQSGLRPWALDADADTLESICAQATMIALQNPGFGFCSDIPMANCVLESSFTVVTSKNARSINETIQKQLSSDLSQSVPRSHPKKTNLPVSRNSSNKHQTRQGADSQKITFRNIALGIIIAVCIIAIIILFALTKQLPK